jgi:hypothetical protein
VRFPQFLFSLKPLVMASLHFLSWPNWVALKPPTLQSAGAFQRECLCEMLTTFLTARLNTFSLRKVSTCLPMSVPVITYITVLYIQWLKFPPTPFSIERRVPEKKVRPDYLSLSLSLFTSFLSHFHIHSHTHTYIFFGKIL